MREIVELFGRLWDATVGKFLAGIGRVWEVVWEMPAEDLLAYGLVAALAIAIPNWWSRGWAQAMKARLGDKGDGVDRATRDNDSWRKG